MSQSVAVPVAVAHGRNLAVVQELLERTAPEGDCLVWQGSAPLRKGRRGYGHTNLGRSEFRTRYAHRLMYEALHGVALRREQFVCHSCDNPPCINPGHLWLGSNSDNILDLVNKGLYVPRHVVDRKTTTAQREEIARRYTRYDYHHSNAQELAEEFGITHSRVRQIVIAAKKAAA